MPQQSPCHSDLDVLKLLRDGTEQSQRFSAALAASTVNVHDQDIARLLVFGRSLSRHLKYFGEDNTEPETWEPFFGRDVSVALATVIKQDVDAYRSAISTHLRNLTDRRNEGNPEVVRANISMLYAYVGTLASQLDALMLLLPTDVRLKATLQTLIERRLVSPLQELIAIAAHDLSQAVDVRLILSTLPEMGPDESFEVLGLAPRSWHELLHSGLSQSWWNGAASWQDFVTSCGINDRVLPGGTIFERGRRFASHALVADALDRFLRVYSRVVREAARDLEITLDEYDHHSPHYALFLAFLKVFEHARDEINTLSSRHLNFYYEDVLRLRRKQSHPSSAFLTVELAKNATSYEISSGTKFKAPKDATGKPVAFTADASVVINKAQVAALRNLVWDGNGQLKQHTDLLASDGPWAPFDSGSTPAEVGFALASHYLYLAEGERTITIDVITAPAVSSGFDELKLSCRLTTSKGWLTLPVTGKVTTTDNDTTTLVVDLKLKPDYPAIIGHDQKVHGTAYDTTLPVIEFVLVPDEKMKNWHSVLSTAAVSSLSVKVNVENLRGLLLSSDNGPIDPSRPFQPFGVSPTPQSSLIVGCPEAFRKKLAQVTIDVNFRAIPSGQSIKLVTHALVGGKFEKSASSESGVPASINVLGAVLEEFNSTDDPALTYDQPFGLMSVSGFIRIQNCNEILPVSNSDTRPSFIPEVDSISVNYNATQKIVETGTFNNCGVLYHRIADGMARASSGKLLPSLTIPTLPASGGGGGSSGSTLSVAELFIGLSAATPGQLVSLLVEVEDGTANPLAVKPASHLYWSYLKDNQWCPLQATDVVDRTQQLLSSGLITVHLPPDATNVNMRMPSGLHWLRVAVTEKPDAVCRIRTLKAQGIRVTFQDRGNDPAYVGSEVEAGTISKLLSPSSAVKSVVQHSASFGGSTEEADTVFHTRASERLRHKDRAISIWDIERIVLGEFPVIFRVKCMNHTRYEPNETGTGIYRELAAGHVTIVPVTRASTSTSDPLRPYVPLSVLADIEEILMKRMSGFATLHVRNPDYEPLRVTCAVGFRSGYDPTYWTTVVKQAIARFLAPWAYDSDARPSFGGKIHASAIINMIEELECVEYLTDFRLSKTSEAHRNLEIAEGSRAVSILTSVEADEHGITVLPRLQNMASNESCECEP
ncbi:MAG: hypothetical protein FGM33_04115 [Candidatus Kapabacteria bacterium]|nr:hypothetical protein [Candidatus Kapabacteria bacterium]